MERHPDGIGGKPLMRKNAPDCFPDRVRRAVPPQGGRRAARERPLVSVRR
ncbi:hypothetical protein ACWDWU_39125 [Streptomyces sp. NPDC003442]